MRKKSRLSSNFNQLTANKIAFEIASTQTRHGAHNENGTARTRENMLLKRPDEVLQHECETCYR